MRYRHLGRSGIKVSEISLGSWRTFGNTVDQETTETCMVAAYEAGVNYFDGAENYGNGAAEEAMGKVLQKYKWPRDSLVISSKVHPDPGGVSHGGLSRKHLVEACDQALQRMGLDYLDLYFCHRPDPDTPLEETVRTMDELIRRGKILYWGTSMFSAAEIMEAHGIAEAKNLTPPTMDQPVYNMLQRELVEEKLALPVERKGLGITVFSPLAIGLLTGKYNEGIPAGSQAERMDPERRKDYLHEEKIKKTRELGNLAQELGIPQFEIFCLNL